MKIEVEHVFKYYVSLSYNLRSMDVPVYTNIDFMKKYPIKYLIIEEIKKEDNYFIKLDEEYHSNKFICKFAFPFIGITINKIILETENSKEINISNLSHSALTSFLERKFFMQFVQKNIWSN